MIPIIVDGEFSQYMMRNGITWSRGGIDVDPDGPELRTVATYCWSGVWDSASVIREPTRYQARRPAHPTSTILRSVIGSIHAD